MHHSCFAPTRYGLAAPIVCIAMLLVVLSACSASQQQQKHKQPPVPVQVTTLRPRTVDVYSKYPGRVEGKREVRVVARVEGILLQRYYNEGDVVEQGDRLFTIDPAPFKATVDQREAALASAKARLHQAQRTWSRVKPLYKADAVSKAERDDALSQLETSRASVQQARADLDSAQIDLGYTHVEAPLTGVTSLRETDEGSLVKNGTRLTTITQLDPVFVLFALPEEDAQARNTALSAMGGGASDAATREASIFLTNDQRYPRAGEVDFTQSTINPDTGTVQLRAVVDNPNNVLMPGSYVRVRIRLETRDDALVVPNKAISSGQQSAQVFVVSKQNKAKSVAVKLGPNVAAGRVVNSGLSPGQRVIVSGLGQLKPGAPVQIKPGGGNTPRRGNAHAGGSHAGGRTDRVGAQPIERSLRVLGSPTRRRVARYEAP